MNAHTCHARNCDVRIPRKMFMCRVHWFMLPRAMRDAVWDAYTPDQESTLDVSPEYLRVTRAAINHVAERERTR